MLNAIAKFLGLPDIDNSWNLGSITSRWKDIYLSGNFISTSMPYNIGHRLTLTSGTPVTTSDVTAATVLYLSPHISNNIRLYTGSYWTTYNLSEISFNISSQNDIDSNAIASSSIYDVFVDYNGGSPQLALKKWSSFGYGTSARATALTRQDGVLVLTGATDHIFVGTIATTSSTQLEDSISNRYVSNYYNRVNKRIGYLRITSSHTYNGATRSWNLNTTTARVRFVCSSNDYNVEVGGYHGTITGSSSTGVVGFSLNNTTNEEIISESRNTSFHRMSFSGSVFSIPTGLNYLQAIESTESVAINTTFIEIQLDGKIGT